MIGQNLIGKYCIVRTYSAGVFAGTLAERDGQEAALTNARRIWYWKGAASLSQLASEGSKEPGLCKFPAPVEYVLLTQVIEILPCTPKGTQSIQSVPIWAA